MRRLTKASTSQTKAAALLRLTLGPEFLIHGIAHTKSHGPHNKALGCHTHVDQVNRHLRVSPALQLVEPICNNRCEAGHSNGDKRCLPSFPNKLGPLTFIV